jgi:hypothetical protein
VNIVETALLENIGKPGSLFVFPTDVAASRWADRLLVLRGGGTVSLEQFTAWDTFKKKSIRSTMQDKKSVSPVLRKMFVAGLIRENAALCADADGAAPVFTSLIRREWARQADRFAGWLAEILPQLGSWFRQAAGRPISLIGESGGVPQFEGFTADDCDLYNLARHYSRFLARHDLFEPAWETPPFNHNGKECFIFFPESLRDFGEYAEILRASDHVKIINVVSEKNSRPPVKMPLMFFITPIPAAK